MHDELAGTIIGYLPSDVRRYCQTLAVGDRLQVHHGLYHLKTLLDVNTFRGEVDIDRSSQEGRGEED